MNIAVLNVGVIRPSFKRVVDNIKQNIQLLNEKYPQYNFQHFNYFYPDPNLEEDFVALCEENNIKCYKLPTADERSYTKGYTLFDNTYKCWKNLENSFIHLNEFIKEEFDAIIRTRLDFEIKNIIIPNEIKDNIIYARQLDDFSIFDNFSILTPLTYNKIYDINIVDACFRTLTPDNFHFYNNEQLLNLICLNTNIKCEDMSFEIQGYQTNDKYWNGSPQWSKSNRNFKF